MMPVLSSYLILRCELMAMFKFLLSRICFGRTSTPTQLPFPDRTIGVATCEQIRHVIVLTMSDHSYDNILGMLPDKGDGLPIDTSGTPTSFVRAVDGMEIPVHHLPSTAQRIGLLNSWEASHMQADGHANDGFVRSAQMFRPGMDSTWMMGYWTEQDIPFWYQLARTFPVADRWFASCLGPELPNRRFLVSGTANGLTEPYLKSRKKPPNGTIFDLLNRHRISWSIFSTHTKKPVERLTLSYQIKASIRTFLSATATLLFRGKVDPRFILLSFLSRGLDIVGTADIYRMRFLTRMWHVEPIESFMQRAHDGNLPSVSFVDPDFSMFSGQPPQDISRAESFVAQVVNAVMHGHGWERTLLIVLFDCHGGYYDHVAPPAAVDPGEVAGRQQIGAADKLATRFDRLGFRVPAILVSPYAKRDYVSNEQYDHTSILKLIETLWNLPPLTARDAMAMSPLDALDLENPPAFREPPTLAAPPDALSWRLRNEPRVFKADTFRELSLRLLLVISYGGIGYLALLTGNTVFQLVAIYLMLLVSVRLVIETGFWRHWIFWKPTPAVDRRAAVYGTTLALAVLTVFFTLFSSEMYVRGLISVKPAVSDFISPRFLEMYLWNLVDAIPGLRITDTFNWSAPFIFLDPWGRSLLIVFRLLVLAPVIDLIGQLLRPRETQEAPI